MADFAISFSNSVNVFGLAPSTKWNEFQWGVGKWGQGTVDLSKQVEKILDANILASTDTHSNEVEKNIGDSESVTMEMTDTKLTDSNGYSYVFPGGTTDAEDQTRTTWSEVSFTNPTWTSGTVRGTSWS